MCRRGTGALLPALWKIPTSTRPDTRRTSACARRVSGGGIDAMSGTSGLRITSWLPGAPQRTCWSGFVAMADTVRNLRRTFLASRSPFSKSRLRRCTPNETAQRTRANRFAHRQIKLWGRLAPVADLESGSMFLYNSAWGDGGKFTERLKAEG